MATRTDLTFSRFIELLLARLYDLERTHGAGRFFDLNAVARELKLSPPSQWVFDAGKVLESRGLVQAFFTFGGGCHAMLTGEGRLYVEREEGSGVIGEYHRDPRNFVIVSGTGNQVVVGDRPQGISQSLRVEEERQPAFHLVADIKRTLGGDDGLSESEKKDLLADVQAIEQQLKKREPNRAALAALLEPLSQIASVAGYVAQLIRLFNG